MRYTYEIKLFGSRNPLIIFAISKSNPFSSMSVCFQLMSLFNSNEGYANLNNLERAELESALLKEAIREYGNTLIKFVANEDQVKDIITELVKDKYSNRIVNVFKRLLVAKESFNSNYLKSRECI